MLYDTAIIQHLLEVEYTLYRVVDGIPSQSGASAWLPLPLPAALLDPSQ